MLLFKEKIKNFLKCPREHILLISNVMGFPYSSVGKESACNAGDPGSVPGSGRSAGEGLGYPLQHSWAFPLWLSC